MAQTDAPVLYCLLEVLRWLTDALTRKSMDAGYFAVWPNRKEPEG